MSAENYAVLCTQQDHEGFQGNSYGRNEGADRLWNRGRRLAGPLKKPG